VNWADLSAGPIYQLGRLIVPEVLSLADIVSDPIAD